MNKGSHERLGRRQRELLTFLGKAPPMTLGIRALPKWQVLKLMFPGLAFSNCKQSKTQIMKGRYFSESALLNNARATYARVVQALERKELIFRINPGRRENEELLSITKEGLKKVT
jgi:hypothetical protein